MRTTLTFTPPDMIKCPTWCMTNHKDEFVHHLDLALKDSRHVSRPGTNLTKYSYDFEPTCTRTLAEAPHGPITITMDHGDDLGPEILLPDISSAEGLTVEQARELGKALMDAATKFEKLTAGEQS